MDHGIGNAPLTVGGDIHVAGNLIKASDRRLKENIVPADPAGVLDRVRGINVVHYDYKPEIAASWNLAEDKRHRVGVVAQVCSFTLFLRNSC